MPASIALLVSLMGWWYLLRHRRLEGERIGLELGIALIWLLIIASRPVSLWFYGWDEADVAAAEEGSLINRSTAAVMMLLGTIILIKRWPTMAEFVNANKLLICLLALCAISAVWSDFPLVAFRRWFRHLLTIIFVLVLLTDKRGFEAVVTAVRYSAYILLPISIVLFKWYSNLGRAYHQHTGEMQITG